jgi:hypothetical protein
MYDCDVTNLVIELLENEARRQSAPLRYPPAERTSWRAHYDWTSAKIVKNYGELCDELYRRSGVGKRDYSLLLF